jgi:aminopeptidase YwaD
MRRLALTAIVALALSLASPATGVASTASFDAGRAIAHATAIAAVGPRVQGTAAEGRAASYCITELRGLGYSVSTMSFRLPNGRISRNVIAAKTGRSPRRIVIGAHLDSKGASPGANDNAAGVGVVLELARAVKDADTEPTVVFVLFGAEEMSGRDPRKHHFGSRTYVSRLTSAQRRAISGMVSVDVVGFGRRFAARTMGIGPATVQSRLRSFASSRGVYLRYIRDTGPLGRSDHEPFERVRIPSVWLEWLDDPTIHTTSDTASRLQTTPIQVTGSTLEAWIEGMTAADLTALRP